MNNNNNNKRYPKSKKDHAEFGPSSLEKYANCPCFTPKNDQEENRFDSEEETPAEIGTRIHRALETLDSSLCKSSYEMWVYNQCLAGVDSVLEHLKFNVSSMRMLRHVDELRLDPIIIGGAHRIFGTVDKAIFRTERGNGKSVVVLDYKTGQVPVAAPEKNPQAHAYVLGIFQNFPEVHTVHFAFIQPSTGDDPSQNIWTATRSEDMGSIDTFIMSVIEQAKGQATRVVSSACCPYCSQVGTCPAVRQKALSLVSHTGLDSIEIGDLEDPEYLKSSEALEACLNIRGIFTKAMEAWTAEAKNKMLSEGLDTLGSYYLTKRGKRTSINKEEFIKSLGDMKASDYIELVGLPPVKKVPDITNNLEDVLIVEDAPEESRQLRKKS